MNDSQILQAILGELRYVKENVESLNSKFESLDAKVTSLDAKVTSLDAKVESLDAKVESLSLRVDSLEQGQRRLEGQVSDLQDKVSVLQSKVDTLQEDVTRIDLTLENDLYKKVDLLFESNQIILRKLEITDKVEPLEDRVSNVERAVVYHTAQIADLQQA